MGINGTILEYVRTHIWTLRTPLPAVACILKLSCRYSQLFPCLDVPKERPGIYDVTLLSGISGLSFDFRFLSPLSSSCSFCLVILRLMVHSPDFFLLKILHYFSIYMAVMIVGRWHMQFAVTWCWYLPLCIFIQLSFFLSIHFLYT